jgi:hypothetical protein
MDLREREALRDRFRSALINASTERSQRPDLVDGDDGVPELEWVRYERQVMWAEVNRCRAELNLPLADLAEIRRVEQQAEGHSDYVAKFAWGCVELATRKG